MRESGVEMMEPATDQSKNDSNADTGAKPQGSRKPPGVLYGALVIGALVLGGVAAAGILPRLSRQEELNKHSAAMGNIKRSVAVVTAQREKGPGTFKLPANLEPIQEIPIFARCDGYLRERFVDIGDTVKAGQTLAVIDAPELDKQLEQARADLRQSHSQVKSAQADLARSQSVLVTTKATVRRLQANLEFSKRQLGRYAELSDEGAISREQKDEKQRDLDSDLAAIQAARAEVEANEAQVNSMREKVEVARGAVASAQANLDRNQSTQNFRYVKTPCNGVITARNVDAGALVSEGSANSVQSLMTVARTDELRVFVFVPQMLYRKVVVGSKVKVEVSEIPGRLFTGTVAKISGGLDAASRTLRVQVLVPNGEHLLKPGMYATVIFENASTAETAGSVPVLIPASSLIVKAQGQFIATVDGTNKVHMVPVVTGRDYGRQIEVLKGLEGGETVVLDPDVDLKEDTEIKPELKQMRTD